MPLNRLCKLLVLAIAYFQASEFFSGQARRQIRNSGGRQSGGGLATAGLVLGWLGLATLLALVALFVWAANETPDTYSGY
mgnify:CR=1 FL=1